MSNQSVETASIQVVGQVLGQIATEASAQATSPLTVGHFLSQLRSRVSQYDAKLILDSAMVSSGLTVAQEKEMTTEEAKTLCLQLIKKGGPAFQVGSAIYRTNKLN
jgi:hypothetical protein